MGTNHGAAVVQYFGSVGAGNHKPATGTCDLLEMAEKAFAAPLHLL